MGRTSNNEQDVNLTGENNVFKTCRLLILRKRPVLLFGQCPFESVLFLMRFPSGSSKTEASPGEVVRWLKKGRVRHIVRGEGELLYGNSQSLPKQFLWPGGQGGREVSAVWEGNSPHAAAAARAHPWCSTSRNHLTVYRAPGKGVGQLVLCKRVAIWGRALWHRAGESNDLSNYLWKVPFHLQEV